jgi:hypothetical protein
MNITSTGAGAYQGMYVYGTGTFKSVGVRYGEKEAFALGKKIVSTTAAATFKIQPVEQYRLSPSKYLSRKQFYTKGELFIERRGMRIKSAGEKREITYRGIQTLKQRRARRFNIFR